MLLPPPPEAIMGMPASVAWGSSLSNHCSAGRVVPNTQFRNPPSTLEKQGRTSSTAWATIVLVVIAATPVLLVSTMMSPSAP
jgi:hypothetical protein